MEEKNIVFTGITQNTSDLDCKDGDLSISHNIINQNGAMRPIILPDASFSMEDGEVLVYVHSSSGYKNYLYIKDGKLKAFSFNEYSGLREDLELEYSLNGNELNQIQSIGNTLIVFFGESKSYILYQDGIYNVLGEEIPEIYIQFGLTGRTRLFSYSDESQSTFTINFDSISESNIYEPFSEENQVKITEQVMAKVNRFVSNQVTEKGYFCFPFFVRYALRLYDGSIIRHSAPILMMPSTSIAPVVMWKRISGKGSYTSAEMDIMLVAASLNYRILPTSGITSLEGWKDIVKSIDFFISPPIYTYDTGGKCTSFNDTDNFSSSFIGRLVDFEKFRSQEADAIWEDAPFMPITGLQQNEDGSYSYPFKDKFLEYTYSQLYGLMYSKDRTYPGITLSLPEKDTDQVREDILNQSLFYYVSNVKTENIDWTDIHEIEISESYLSNLTLKERMTDDWQTHDKLSTSYSYMYNQRLNIANIKRNLFDGFPALSMLCKKDSVHNYSVNQDTNELNINTNILGGSTDEIDIYTYINEGNRDIVVKSSLSLGLFTIYTASFVSLKDSNNEYQKKSWPSFLYYPNPNAYKMVLVDNYLNNKYEVELKEHSSLNGAYAFIGFDSVMMNNSSVQVMPSTDKSVNAPNKIYTSEVNNPFYFPLEGINTVGVGEIVGISSTTNALSQGQFGQFPLIVFSTDGIWAMEVSDEGLYRTKQPISRDVCSNPRSITQIDGAIIFVSGKGVMLIEGSSVNIMSSELDGSSFDFLSVERFGDILEKEKMLEEIGSQVPAKDFFKNCRIAYDYPNGRLLFFNENSLYAYVYSINSGTWATMSSDIVICVSDYPNSFIQLSSGDVVNFSTKQDYDSEKTIKTLLLSRPIKLDDDSYKTVNGIINRGNIHKSTGATIIFASYDGNKYVPVGSSLGYRITRLQGSPYRYFRIMNIRDMSIKEFLSFSSVYFTRKWRNKAR